MKLTTAEKNALDSLDYVLQASGVRVTSHTIREHLYLHPDFPSLVSLSDVLNEWNIPNLVPRISPQQLTEAPLPAIAFLEINGGYFAPVRKASSEGGVEWLDTRKGWQFETLSTFTQKWSGIVLLIEPDERSGETDYISMRRAEIRQNLRVPFLVVGIVVSFLLWFVASPATFPTAQWTLNALWAVKLAGTLVCSILLWHSMDADNPFIRTLCSLNSRTHCNSILHSKAARLWGWLGWSEIGFVYFAGGLTTLLLSLYNPQINVLPWLLSGSLLTLPYTIFSVYYQALAARQWCLLCLSVQILLWIEVAINLSLWHSVSFTLSVPTAAILIFSFLLPTLIWVLLKKPLQESYRVYPLLRELHRVKFNFEYVESLFARQPQMPPIFEGMRVIKIGNAHAEHMLTVVTNPLCGPCQRMHPDLEALIQSSSNVNCQFVFIGTSASAVIIHKLLSLAPEYAEQAMHLWYRLNNHNITKWIKALDGPVQYSDTFQQLELHTRWCELAEIRETPTIYLNGRQLPLSYNLNDVESLCRILHVIHQPQELANSYKSIV